MNNINKNLCFIFYNKLKYIIDWDNPICINKYESFLFEDTLLIPVTTINIKCDTDNSILITNTIKYTKHFNIEININKSYMKNYNNIEY